LRNKDKLHYVATYEALVNAKHVSPALIFLVLAAETAAARLLEVSRTSSSELVCDSSFVSDSI